MNPLSLDLNKGTLFIIVSGKAARKEAILFLLHVNDIGNRAPKEFIEECKSNPRRFKKQEAKGKRKRKGKETEDT